MSVIPSPFELITFLLGSAKLYRHTAGVSMGTNCAPLIADRFLYCYERDFVLSLSPDSQLDIY